MLPLSLSVRRFLVLAVAAALMASFIPGVSAPRVHAQQAPGDIFISEFHYDNGGADAGEFVEVTAPAGTDLTGWSIVLYNGTGGASYDTDSFTGTVANQSVGFGTMVIDYPSNGIQNGSPDGIALVDDEGTLIEFLSYEGDFAGVGGPADGVTSTDIGVSQNGTGPLGASIDRTDIVPGGYTWVSNNDNTKGDAESGAGHRRHHHPRARERSGHGRLRQRRAVRPAGHGWQPHRHGHRP